MAHEITIRPDGVAEMAFTGKRSAIWHGLGQELQGDETLEEWKKLAGLDWEVFESCTKYETAAGEMLFPDRKVLFRSDTNAPLSIVSNDFKVVQPDEVIEFFRDLVSQHGMKLNTAGTLFGGKRFWGFAETGKEAQVVEGDTIKGFLLLTTAVDGTLATTAKFVSNRVVCNNTLSIALASGGSNNVVKKTHRATFDPKSVKIDLGLIDEGWDNFVTNLRKLAETKVTQMQVNDFLQNMFFKKEVLAKDQSWGVTRMIDETKALVYSGTGSDMGAGTAWGLLNGITEKFTHGTGRRSGSHQFWDSFYGKNDQMKVKAYNSLVLA